MRNSKINLPHLTNTYSKETALALLISFTCRFKYNGQFNFKFEYLGEIETEFENVLVYESGAQVGSIDENTQSWKSRATVTLR